MVKVKDKIFRIKLIIEINRTVDVGKITFLSAAEKITYQAGNREFCVMTETIKKVLILFGDRCVYIPVSFLLLSCPDSSHILGLVRINSWSAALIVQYISPLNE